MGKCKYCKEKAGFFKYKHSECEELHLSGKNQITDFANTYFTDNKKVTKKELSKVALNSFINKTELLTLLANVYDDTLEKELESDNFSYEIEDKLNKFSKFYKIPKEILDIKDSVSKTVRASILREQNTTGEIFNRMIFDEYLPFVFQKNEQLVYLFENVELFEQKIHTKYVGGSDGFSVRIAKGLYYRKSTFRGKPIKETSLDLTEIGTFALTNKHLYFAGDLKNFRIRFDKIISVNPYTDGIGIQKDGVTAKPQTFKNVDGWFCYNFIKNAIN